MGIAIVLIGTPDPPPASSVRDGYSCHPHRLGHRLSWRAFPFAICEFEPKHLGIKHAREFMSGSVIDRPGGANEIADATSKKRAREGRG